MDAASLLGGFFGGLVITYPISRLAIKLLTLIQLNSKQLILVSGVSTVMLCIIFSLLVGADSKYENIIYYTIGMIIHSFLDFERSKHTSKIIRIINHWVMRWTIIILTFILLFIVFIQFTTGLIINDPYYITPLVFAFIYVYFAFKRKKEKVVYKINDRDFEQSV